MIKDKKQINFIQWLWKRSLFYVKARKLPPWPYRYRHIKKKIIKNNPLPVFLKKFRGTKSKIAIINERIYWMQYFENVLSIDDRFVSRSFAHSPSQQYSSPYFNINDPETLNIVTGGKYFFGGTYFDEIYLTKWHQVLVRVQHSPGFGLISFIEDYDWVKNNGFKLMVPKKHWDFILKTDTFPDRILKLREEIVNDGVPLAFTHYDPKLNRIFNSPKIMKRVPGTVLISLNFRISNNNDIKRLLMAIECLSKNLKVTTANLHPITKEHLDSSIQSASLLLDSLQNSTIGNITTQGPIQDMVNLYDAHEYIVTDGSGTAYEAVARGCKALTLDGLTYQSNKDKFHHTLELGLLPKTLVWNYQDHPGNQMDMEWLMNLFPTSLVKNDVSPLVAQEMVGIFDNWQ